MLASLRLDRIVGRDDQQGHIHARGAGKHIANEPLVARHIDDAKTKLIDFQLRKS